MEAAEKRKHKGETILFLPVPRSTAVLEYQFFFYLHLGINIAEDSFAFLSGVDPGRLCKLGRRVLSA